MASLRRLVALLEQQRDYQQQRQALENQHRQLINDLAGRPALAVFDSLDIPTQGEVVEASFNGRIFVHPRYMAEAIAYAREHGFEHMILNQEDLD